MFTMSLIEYNTILEYIITYSNIVTCVLIYNKYFVKI